MNREFKKNAHHLAEYIVNNDKEHEDFEQHIADGNHPASHILGIAYLVLGLNLDKKTNKVRAKL